MPFFLLLFIYAGGPVPMKVSIGDPVLNIEVTTFDSRETINLRDLFDEGFCFFLSPDCSYCKNAYANIATLFDRYPVFMLFVGDHQNIEAFLDEQNGEKSNVYLVDEKSLKRYDIVTLPGVVSYKDGKCRTAMHGPMKMKDLNRLIAIFEGTYFRIKNPNE